MAICKLLNILNKIVMKCTKVANMGNNTKQTSSFLKKASFFLKRFALFF